MILLKTTTIKLLMIISLVGIIVISFPDSAMALSMGVTPGKLEINLSEEHTSGSLNIINSGSEASHYKIYVANSAYNDYFNIEPAEFNLHGNSTMTVNINIQDDCDLPDNFIARICVISVSPENGMKCGVGVRVPVFVNKDINN
jgi:P pilus assembly chaperone PapD